jgi:phthiocerol/phenolphthiocerol synthesis type-I polyketide synthase E
MADRASGMVGAIDDRIAVVGLAVRVPGALDAHQLWENLIAGRESISRFSEAELLAAGEDEQLLRDPRYVPAAGALEGYDCFDASFFGFSPREASLLDPQHRVFLECCWHALEDARLHDGGRGERIGVFAGDGKNAYLWRHVLPGGDVDPLEAYLANESDFLAPHVAYKLDLDGPAISVQTACSTSLVAVHYACQSLLAHETDVALAGGVAIELPQNIGYLHRAGSTTSADGRCRPFDAAASGLVDGSGAGVVVLRRQEDAVREADPIRATIRGSAVNNDGADKVGFTAPAVAGQVAVVTEALAVAGVEPGEIGYVEAHGTGTPIGDPVEMEALARVFGDAKAGTCLLGSIKANVGHLDAAAGVAGLIKAVLALEHGMIPPHPNLTELNPLIDFAQTPFEVNTEPVEWRRRPRLAAVSSFGMGGTNAHLILEAAPEVQADTISGSGPYTVFVSAPYLAGLGRVSGAIADALEAEPEATAALAYSSAVGRRHWSRRRAVVADSSGELAAKLRTGSEPGVAAADRVVFLFPGQGSQTGAMAATIGDGRIRATIEECCAALDSPRAEQVLEALTVSGSAGASQIDRTEIAQPALFAFEYALARRFLDWGLHPCQMVGHSIGEYVAAAIAGVLEPAVGMWLVAERGRLMGSCADGAMVAVATDPGRVEELVGSNEEGGIAAVTAPRQVVVAGSPAYVERAEATFEREALRFRRLRTSHAFHSPLMDPVVEEFAEVVATVDLREPRRAFYSGVTGAPIRPGESRDPSYWASQLRRPVLLALALEAAISGSPPVFLELGSGRALTGLVREQAGSDEVATVAVSGREGVDAGSIAEALAGIWEAGVDLDWRRLHQGGPYRRASLPAFPFARDRHWIEAADAVPVDAAGTSVASPQDLAPAPEAKSTNGEAGLAAEIAAVFAAAFGVESVGLDEDFFALGGNSLVAIELIDRVAGVAGAEVSLQMLYEAPRPAQLAAALERGDGQDVALDELVAELEGLEPGEVQTLLQGLEPPTKEGD